MILKGEDELAGWKEILVVIVNQEREAVCISFTRQKPQVSAHTNAAMCCWVTSVVSDSVRPQRRQPTRLPHPWDSPGKNTGVGCHFLLQCMKVKSESEVAQSCPTLATPWTAAHQVPPSMGFSRQEYWSGVPLPSPELCLLFLNSKSSEEVTVADSWFSLFQREEIIY